MLKAQRLMHSERAKLKGTARTPKYPDIKRNHIMTHLQHPALTSSTSCSCRCSTSSEDGRVTLMVGTCCSTRYREKGTGDSGAFGTVCRESCQMGCSGLRGCNISSGDVSGCGGTRSSSGSGACSGSRPSSSIRISSPKRGGRYFV